MFFFLFFLFSLNISGCCQRNFLPEVLTYEQFSVLGPNSRYPKALHAPPVPKCQRLLSCSQREFCFQLLSFFLPTWYVESLPLQSPLKNSQRIVQGLLSRAAFFTEGEANRGGGRAQNPTAEGWHFFL